MKSKFDCCGSFSAVVVMTVSFAISEFSARAQSEMELTSGATTVFLNGVNGLASFDGSLGGWDVNFVTGLATPASGPGAIDLDSSDLSIAGTGDPLTILWSGSGYTQTGGYAATVGGVMAAGMSATFTSFYGSLASTATPLTASFSFGPYASTTAFSGSATGSVAGPGPFALTEQVVISGGTDPLSHLGFDFNVLAVPEPSTIALLLVGGVGLALRRRKGKKLSP